MATLDTFGDVKTYVATKRRDVDFEHWNEDLTENDINLAIQWLTDEVPLGNFFGTFEQAPDAANTGEYVPPLGVALDETASLKTGTRNLIRTTATEIGAFDTTWDTRAGTPTHYIPDFRRDSQQRRVVRVYPLPPTALTDLKGEGTRVHPWLTAADDPLLVPIQCRIAICAYALHLGYAGDQQETQDLAKANWWKREADEALARAKKKAARRGDRSPATVTIQR